MGMQCEQVQEPSARAAPLICRPDGIAYRATYQGTALLLQMAHGEENSSRWTLTRQLGQLKLERTDFHTGMDAAELLAALEAAFTHYPNQAKLNLLAPVGQAEELFRSGVLLKGENNQLTVHTELFWQQSRVWLASPQPYAFPPFYIVSDGRRHPLRPPKPVDTVYRRYIPWLDRMLSFRAVKIPQDLERFSRWMNDRVVAAAWKEEGDLVKHRGYLEGIAADPHVIGLIGCLDDEAFGYFEVYWAKEDRVAPFYDADDFDRGWHVLIGEPHLRGKPFVTAWLPSISHYLFLDDCRTRRIVIEPRSDNHKMIRNLGKCGYANLKEFDFPHKHVVLSMLLRERFFAGRLWVPRDAVAAPPSVSLF